MADSLVETDRGQALEHLSEAAGLMPDNSDVRERLSALEAMAAEDGTAQQDDDVIFLDEDEDDGAEVDAEPQALPDPSDITGEVELHELTVTDDEDDEPELALDDADDDEPLMSLEDELEPDSDGPELQLDADGVCRVRSFPGLWVHAEALLARDHGRLMAVLSQGLATAEHANFVARLAAARSGGS